MKQIDLDDLPPRVASIIAALESDEDLIFVQGGAVVGRLRRVEPPPPAQAQEGPSSEGGMEEVMEHFNAMIHDQF